MSGAPRNGAQHATRPGRGGAVQDRSRVPFRKTSGHARSRAWNFHGVAENRHRHLGGNFTQRATRLPVAREVGRTDLQQCQLIIEIPVVRMVITLEPVNGAGDSALLE